jgi:CRISPR system Cascade subunit CasE
MVQTVSRFWLSRLEFRRPPRDAHELHAALWAAFPDGERSFLFRADRTETDASMRLRVLVQSRVEARWSALEANLASCEQVQRDWTLTPGDRLRFLLRANPTVRRKGSHDTATRDWHGEEYRKRAGHRVALLRDEERLDWLNRKAAAGGFAVEGARIQNKVPCIWSKKNQTATHDGCDFEGLLHVTDSVAFAATLDTGIGSGKAFGFGLLSIAAIE